MTATDATALQERIAEELYYERHPEGRHRNEWPAAVYPDTVYEYRDLAAAVLPLIAAEVQAAKAAAWDEGYEAGMLDTYRLGRDMDLTITPAPNPYRETGDRA